MGKHYRFIRRVGFKPLKKLFLIACEGAESEPRYFEEFKLRVSRDSIIRIKLVANPKHGSHPEDVLRRLRSAAQREGIRSGDDLWLVIDRDAWNEANLDEVCRRAKKEGIFVALSNPCFELWIYLHLENNRHFVDRHHCQRKLAEVCESYKTKGKGGYDAKALMKTIDDAISRAKGLDSRPGDPWPRNQATRVYQLVEKLAKGTTTRSSS